MFGFESSALVAPHCGQRIRCLVADHAEWFHLDPERQPVQRVRRLQQTPRRVQRFHFAPLSLSQRASSLLHVLSTGGMIAVTSLAVEDSRPQLADGGIELVDRFVDAFR